ERIADASTYCAKPVSFVRRSNNITVSVCWVYNDGGKVIFESKVIESCLDTCDPMVKLKIVAGMQATGESARSQMISTGRLDERIVASTTGQPRSTQHHLIARMAPRPAGVAADVKAGPTEGNWYGRRRRLCDRLGLVNRFGWFIGRIGRIGRSK